MSVVVDSSIAASWCLPDELSEASEASLDLIEQGGMIVPPLFWYQLRNILIISERRGRIESSLTESALKRIGALPVQIDGEHDETMLLSIARDYSLTVYDAAYLELAKRLEAPLATLDKAIMRTAEKLSIDIV